jgi:tRNA pseudouridine32 synthase/23S rRNA pseudouridine746 synthase
MSESDYFKKFKQIPENYSLPEALDFPFYYTPHELAEFAANQLQEELSKTNFNHDFGIEKKERNGAIGKMFGVLVVQNKNGDLGYLKAFSGKLGERNWHEGFVPPVFDLLEKDGFFKTEEKYLNELNKQIEKLENDPIRKIKEDEYTKLNSETLKQLSDFRLYLKKEKKTRAEIREKEKEKLEDTDYQCLIEKLKKESISQQIEYKKLNKELNHILANKKEELLKFEHEIESLKKVRGEKSNALQDKIFDQYTFLNQAKESKSLLEIFKETIFEKPPAGAGECAAPKLFQYAFQNDLTPICMAEFWWGMSPDSEIRVHKNFYPACRGKCEPILKHMLGKSKVSQNPLNTQSVVNELEIIYEDEWIVAVNKPPEFLSVPGKQMTDSVLTRLQLKYPDATGPLLVHRLDMSTSGILLAAKDKDIHKALQNQFIKRKVEKVYRAVIERKPKKLEGTIDLPLTLDFLDRPKQKICFEEGKKAITTYKFLKSVKKGSLIEFQPLTGRTHQLRIHAAHHLGLNSPIVGDDLYGMKEKRLYLHAQKLRFIHPISKKNIIIECPENFV